MILKKGPTSVPYNLGKHCANGHDRSEVPEILVGDTEPYILGVEASTLAHPECGFAIGFGLPGSQVPRHLMAWAGVAFALFLTGAACCFSLCLMLVRHVQHGFSGDDSSGSCDLHANFLKQDSASDKQLLSWSGTKEEKSALSALRRMFEIHCDLLSPDKDGKLMKGLHPKIMGDLDGGQRADLYSISRECAKAVGRKEVDSRAAFEPFFQDYNLKLKAINDEGIAIVSPTGAEISLHGGIMGQSTPQQAAEINCRYESLFGADRPDERAEFERSREIVQRFSARRETEFKKRFGRFEQSYLLEGLLDIEPLGMGSGFDSDFERLGMESESGQEGPRISVGANQLGGTGIEEQIEPYPGPGSVSRNVRHLLQGRNSLRELCDEGLEINGYKHHRNEQLATKSLSVLEGGVREAIAAELQGHRNAGLAPSGQSAPVGDHNLESESRPRAPSEPSKPVRNPPGASELKDDYHEEEPEFIWVPPRFNSEPDHSRDDVDQRVDLEPEI